MNKVNKISFLFLLIIVMSLSFSCKKSIPEIKEEEEQPKKEEQVKEEPKNEETKTTEVIVKITDEQFNEAEELIVRAKNALADIYDKENYDGSIENLKLARDKNDNEPKIAFEHLDKSRKMSQESYYNAFKKRALEKKAEAERLISDIQSSGGDKVFSEMYNEALVLFNQGDSSFNEENYTKSFSEFSESVDKLKNLKTNQNKIQQEYESRIKYIKDLIDKAEKLGAKTYAPDTLQLAKDFLTEGIDLYRVPNLVESKDKLALSEENALIAIDLTNKALKEIKRLEALEKIKSAGKSLEKAANKEIIDENGKSGTGLDYKFEFDENAKGEINNAPDNLTYKDVLLKAVEYIEKAKESYINEDYEMAIRYAEIAQRIADSYKAGGIKTHYTVRLIPEKRDCLWRISGYEYIYDNSFYWPVIWKTNKEKILNPDLIFPGQVFSIPELD